MSFFHPDAPTGDTGMGSCGKCFLRLRQLVAEVTTERNAAIFFRRHDDDGKVIGSWDAIAADYGLTTATIRHTVRFIWRKLAARHLRQCQAVPWARPALPCREASDSGYNHAPAKGKSQGGTPGI